MFRFLGFLFKVILVLGGLLAISQLDYKGRKIETYVVEALKSETVAQGINYVKTLAGSDKAKKDQPVIFKSANAMSEYTESERKELQSLMDK
ncbi:MAG: hypothetical protein JXA66_08935 [Oligoflexia bacterium]|nr:hypothetical protein [Oligoflexia bacterium]